MKGSYSLVMYEFSIHHPLSYVILCYENKKKYFSILKPTLWLWKNYFGMQDLFIYHAAFMSRNIFWFMRLMRMIFITSQFDIISIVDLQITSWKIYSLLIFRCFSWYFYYLGKYSNIICIIYFTILNICSFRQVLSYITECRHRWDLNYFLNVHFSFL